MQLPPSANVLYTLRQLPCDSPRFAKSAATLLALGAKSIYLGSSGELGPLDAQIFDPDRELPFSALDEAQALERIHQFALTAFDMTMFQLLNRSGKRIDRLMPVASTFVSSLLAPMINNLDPVHYTQMARALDIARHYAETLLLPHYARDDAVLIAHALVREYPDHSYVIDSHGARQLAYDPYEANRRVGLHVEELTDELDVLLDRLWLILRGLSHEEVMLLGDIVANAAETSDGSVTTGNGGFSDEQQTDPTPTVAQPAENGADSDCSTGVLSDEQPG